LSKWINNQRTCSH